MNRKLLVGVLITLAVANIGTLMATGILSLDQGVSNSSNTITLDGATGLTAGLSTTILPRIHQHYKVDLTVSLGNCVNPYGRAC